MPRSLDSSERPYPVGLNVAKGDGFLAVKDWCQSACSGYCSAFGLGRQN